MSKEANGEGIIAQNSAIFGKDMPFHLDAFAIGDALSDGICLTNEKGIVLKMNKVYEEIIGISAKEMLGQNIGILKKRVESDEIVSLMVIRQRKKISLLKTIGIHNKKVLINGYPYYDKAGELIGVLTVIRDLTELIEVRELLEKSEKERERYLSELTTFREEQNSSLVGKSAAITKIRELIFNIAKTDATVLITGETGCGKEVIAKEIHQNSGKEDAPYIKVNCVAIPDALLESELFGYEKGAFTGALNKTKLGVFELASGGTLLLDEIGDMPMHLQSKLLRVLQEKEIRRIGGRESISLDIRVIASTNKDLKALIAEKKFREDLYYRLNVVPVYAPPVRERKEDIPLLVNHFLNEFNKKYNRSKILDRKVMALFESYDWPGNVRELSNVIERLIVSDHSKLISEESVIKILRKKPFVDDEILNSPTLKDAVEGVEKKIIEEAIRKHGSTYKAANALGTSQSTLFRKVKYYGILVE